MSDAGDNKGEVELQRQIADAFRPVREISEQLSEQYRRVADELKALQPDARFLALQKQLADSLRPVEGAWAAIADEFKRLNERFAPIAEALKKTLEDFPRELRPLLLPLAERGWFVSDEMDHPFIRELLGYIEAGDLAKVDEFMEAITEYSIPRVRGRIDAKFPSRKPIVDAAFQAHSSELYALAVPVFLIQAEGICIDTLGVKLFSRRGNQPLTKGATAELIRDAWTEATLLPLQTPLPISANRQERKMYPEVLNRHEILHGVDVAYPSKRNSLKAISLLAYLVTMVAEEVTLAAKASSGKA